jgi:hypothetical protein
MNYEIDPVEIFFHNVIEFVEEYTFFKNYLAMEEEKRKKYVEKLVLLITFETSPRKNFNISRDTLRQVVREILDEKAAELKNEE